VRIFDRGDTNLFLVSSLSFYRMGVFLGHSCLLSNRRGLGAIPTTKCVGDRH